MCSTCQVLLVISSLFNTVIMKKTMVLFKRKVGVGDLKFLIFICIFAYLFLTFDFFASAQECPATDYDCQIKGIQREIDALAPAHEKNTRSDILL